MVQTLSDRAITASERSYMQPWKYRGQRTRERQVQGIYRAEVLRNGVNRKKPMEVLLREKVP